MTRFMHVTHMTNESWSLMTSHACGTYRDMRHETLMYEAHIETWLSHGHSWRVMYVATNHRIITLWRVMSQYVIWRVSCNVSRHDSPWVMSQYGIRVTFLDTSHIWSQSPISISLVSFQRNVVKET